VGAPPFLVLAVTDRAASAIAGFIAVVGIL
jgi:hypothetical protein